MNYDDFMVSLSVSSLPQRKINETRSIELLEASKPPRHSAASPMLSDFDIIIWMTSPARSPESQQRIVPRELVTDALIVAIDTVNHYPL